MKTVVFLKVNNSNNNIISTNTTDSDDVCSTTSHPTLGSLDTPIYTPLPKTTTFISSYDTTAATSTNTNNHKKRRFTNMDYSNNNADRNNKNNHHHSMNDNIATGTYSNPQKCITPQTATNTQRSNTTNRHHYNQDSFETSPESNGASNNCMMTTGSTTADADTCTVAASCNSITYPMNIIQYPLDNECHKPHHKEMLDENDDKYEKTLMVDVEQLQQEESLTMKVLSANELRIAVRISGCIVVLLVLLSIVLIGVIISRKQNDRNNDTSSISTTPTGGQQPPYYDTNTTTTTTTTGNNNTNGTYLPTLSSSSSSSYTSLCTSSVYTTLLLRPSNIGGENGKKGIGMTLRELGKNGSYIENIPKIQQLNVYWNYAWNMNRIYQQPTTIPMYVPMFFGHHSMTKQKLHQLLKESYIYEHIQAGTVQYFLGYNEPDKIRQGNMNVSTAIELWPVLQTLNIPLISPSPANIHGTWMDEFMTIAKQKCYRIDYIGVHWYGNPSFQSFVNAMTKIYNKYQLPLVLTEFAPADWKAFTEQNDDNDDDYVVDTSTTSSSSSQHTPANVLQFMKQALPWLERTEWIAGYAWFSFHYTSTHGWASALFDEHNLINALGRYYQSVTTNNPYGNQSIEIF